jgi:putative acetyltransferase
MENSIRQILQRDNLELAQMIRKVFHEHEAPQCGTVYSDPTTDDLFSLFNKPKSVLWVAEIDQKALGCCGIYPTNALPEGCTELVKFYLAKEARGKGIGKNLMLKCIASAREMGYKQIYLESLPHFAQAISMYEKEGFIRLDKALGESGHSTCNIWMLKSL